MKKKNYFNIAWIFMIAILILGVLDFRFGVLAFICMLAPIYFSLRRRGKVNCTSYCPRGSFLNKFMQKISMGNIVPKFMLKRWFKNLVIVAIFTAFGYNMAISGGDLKFIGYAVLRMVVVTTVIAIGLGIYYKPRTWCAVCPMGTLSGDIAKWKKVKN